MWINRCNVIILHTFFSIDALFSLVCWCCSNCCCCNDFLLFTFRFFYCLHLYLFRLFVCSFLLFLTINSKVNVLVVLTDHRVPCSKITTVIVLHSWKKCITNFIWLTANQIHTTLQVFISSKNNWSNNT